MREETHHGLRAQHWADKPLKGRCLQCQLRHRILALSSPAIPVKRVPPIVAPQPLRARNFSPSFKREEKERTTAPLPAPATSSTSIPLHSTHPHLSAYLKVRPTNPPYVSLCATDSSTKQCSLRLESAISNTAHVTITSRTGIPDFLTKQECPPPSPGNFCDGLRACECGWTCVLEDDDPQDPTGLRPRPPHRPRELAAGLLLSTVLQTNTTYFRYVVCSPVTVFSVLERSWLSEVSGGFPPFVSMVGYRIGTYPAPPSSPSSNGSLAESVDAEAHLGFLIDGIADPAD
ncbi:hypothetical protein CFIO01_09632 [Colletotrichum fioriniae PJ7]|uniref:Uncharacterized protein n=1 Tax=Colletotrichum fioriniae PJ7 TaxID=1445577 RepID=A0A010RWV2_9PEZI|nr:hypothetical protein CFIO01_09632 [Colletotrichum fioriniae PJ7]